jgi:tetratricopeptide (TPR) repeat protein
MALNPNVPEIHYTLAETFRQLGRRAEAIEQYRRALELRPGWSYAASQLAALEGGKP